MVAALEVRRGELTNVKKCGGSACGNRPVNNSDLGAVGNCGVGILVGPGTSTIAAGLSKNSHFTERLRLRFEATFTNLMNHRNLAPPSTNVTASSFGVVQALQTAENSGNTHPSAGGRLRCFFFSLRGSHGGPGKNPCTFLNALEKLSIKSSAIPS